ncbi:hypothetical protein Tco_0864038 [Tanacetum coccineum]
MDVNQYPAVPNEFVNMGYNSYNYASTGYKGCNSTSNNISNPQYFRGYTVDEYSQNVARTNLYSNGMNVISLMNVKQVDPQFVTYNENASFFVNEYAYGSKIYEVFDVLKITSILQPGSGWNCAFHSSRNSYQFLLTSNNLNQRSILEEEADFTEATDMYIAQVFQCQKCTDYLQ